MRVERLLGRVNGFCGWERSKKKSKPARFKNRSMRHPLSFQRSKGPPPAFLLSFWLASESRTRPQSLFPPSPPGFCDGCVRSLVTKTFSVFVTNNQGVGSPVSFVVRGNEDPVVLGVLLQFSSLQLVDVQFFCHMPNSLGVLWVRF